LILLKPFFDEYKDFPIENCDFIDMMVIMEAAHKYIKGKSRIAQANQFKIVHVWNGRNYVAVKTPI
jgi:hypothetical protein